jgi:hypothetical protein
MTDIPWASSRRLFSPSVREDDICVAAMGEEVVRLRGSLRVPSGWAKPLQEPTESQ